MRDLRELLAKIGNHFGEVSAGQRWTSSLAVGLALTIMLVGLPPKVILDGSSDVLESSPRADEPTAEATDAGPSPAPNAPRAPLIPPATPLPSSDPADQEVAVEPSPVPAGDGIPAMVALARQTGPPSRTELDVAKFFLDSAGIPVAVSPYGSPDACEDAARTGDLVIAGELDIDLRTCLLAAGVEILAFDELGSGPGVVSTRRGAAASLIDLVRWGVADGALSGPVGIAASNRFKPAIAPLLDPIRALGVDLRAVAYVDESGPALADISDGVRSLAGQGVGTVILGLSAESQQRWVGAHTVFDPDVSYVVSDLGHTFEDEVYPVSFNGALAHTSVRVPWFEREHGETDSQRVCREAWEEASSAFVEEAERRLVYTWCLNASLLSAAVDETGPTHDFGGSLRSLQLPSPLTADLGPLSDTGWGPMADAVLRWDASCSCWVEQREFTPRT